MKVKMIRYTSILLTISILLLMIDLIHLSSEYEKYSTESEIYDENYLDRTIDVTDKEDRNKESASKSLEEEINGQSLSVGQKNTLENYESSLEGNLSFILPITIQKVPVFLPFCLICFVSFDSF